MKVRVEMSLDINESALKRYNAQNAASAARNYGFGSFGIGANPLVWDQTDLDRALEHGVAILRKMAVLPDQG